MRKRLLLVAIFAVAPQAWATCSGSGITWSCTSGSTTTQIQNAVNAASDGFTITLANGTYTATGTVNLTTPVGGTIICASVQGCTINTGANNVFFINTGANDTHFYRISGFIFDSGGGGPGSQGVITFLGTNATMPGPNGIGGFRIDHNKFQNLNTANFEIFFGDTGHCGQYSGSVDNNTFTNSSQYGTMHSLGEACASYLSNTLGSPNEVYYETNTINFTSLPDISNAGCEDSWTGSYALRYNTATNCLWTAHGVTHGGGHQSIELYNNNTTLNSGSTQDSDCYRCFHDQGSGVDIAFNNVFTAPTTNRSEVLSIGNYRGDAHGPSEDGGIVACDGTVVNQSEGLTTFSDGNRTPSGSNYGYPCWHQPGRDFAGNYAPLYAWNNLLNGTLNAGWVDPDITQADIDGAAVVPNGTFPPNNCNTSAASGTCDYDPIQMVANREWYNAVSSSAQSSATSPFNGTTGMGFGTLANRPTTCTTNATESGAGVGYFATDVGNLGTLFTCSSTNKWSVLYAPYPYPHPLIVASGVGSTPYGSIKSGTYSSAQSLTLASLSGSVICYTTNSALSGTTTPVTAGNGSSCTTGTKYTSAVSVSTTEVIEAVAGNSGATDSAVASFTIQVNAGGPPDIALTCGGACTTLAFGNQTINTSSAAQVITVQNTGNSDLTLTSINFTSGLYFSKTSTCGATLAAQSTCTVTVTFSPTVLGALSDTLTFTDNANSGTTQTVSLSGTGEAGPSVGNVSPRLSIIF